MDKSPAFFVDAQKGSDQNDGSKTKPWKTLRFAIGKLTPGTTLYLRGGVFHETVALKKSGEPGKPITIRSHPGELAVLDGGIPEFLYNPAACWEPATNGVSHEYVSTKSFPDWGQARLLGSFADSMVPLHVYRFPTDLRAEVTGFWRLKAKDDPEPGMYCGPGIWFDETTKRIHIRLAPTQFDWLGKEGNYRGETDPRTISLVIAGGSAEGVLMLKSVRHIRFQDIVLRGSCRTVMFDLQNAEDIECDGLTFFGGSPALRGQSTKSLRVVNCAFRGLGSAPWESRASMKYRGKPGYVIHAVGGTTMNQDWEIAQSEFTDGHDFALIRFVRNLRFHHNFVENFNDDAMEFGPLVRDQLAWVYCNLISQCLVTLTQHELGKDTVETDPGSGVYVFRNVIDIRRPTYGSPPDGITTNTLSHIWRTGELGGDHGSPIWSQYYFYQNTVLRNDSAWRDHYAFGLGNRGLAGRSKRVVLNNIFLQVKGLPGIVLPPKPDEVDLQVDGNLFWGVEQGPTAKGDFFAKVRQSASIEESKKQYPPGWTAHDTFGDPKFVRWSTEKGNSPDLSLQKTSPAINAGVKAPADWPDPIREQDKGAPDIGAFPWGVTPWRVGVNGRLPLCPDAP